LCPHTTMAALGQFWQMMPTDMYSVDEWKETGRKLYSTTEWMVFASMKYLRSLNMSDDFITCLVGGIVVGLVIIMYNVYNPGEAFDYSTDSMTSDEVKDEMEKMKQEAKDEMAFVKAEAARQLAAEKEAGAAVKEPSGNEAGLRKRKGKKGKPPADSSSKEETGTVVAVERSKDDMYQEAKERVLNKKLEKVDEAAASMRNNAKFRKLLGVTDENIEDVVAKTKNDVRMGVTPSEPTNFAAWFDTFFFVAMAVALCYFANRDYGFNVLFWLEKHFPKEGKVIRAFGGN